MVLKESPIILTADESLMLNPSEHIFQNYLTCFPPNPYLEKLIKRMVVSLKHYENGEVQVAPLSLRIVESILFNAGLQDSYVKTVHPAYLDRYISDETKIVGISVIDPLGLGPLSSTIKAFLGGEPYLKLKFLELISKLRKLKEKYHFKIVIGGPGSWQLANKEIMDFYNIDYVFIGEGEKILPKLFYDLLNGSPPTRNIIFSEPADPEEIPSIRKSTIGGMIEATRGCDRGCSWCYSSKLNGRNNMRTIPVDTIKKSAKVAAVMNNGRILLQSDDILRYGSKNFIPDIDMILNLLKELCEIKEVKKIAFLHFTFSSIATCPDILQKIEKFLGKCSYKNKIIQVGLETGSVRLLRKYMYGKILPFKPEEWHETVREACKILKNNNWFCYTTLIIGFPDEERDDVRETIELINKIDVFPLIIVPLLYTPLLSFDGQEHKPLIHNRHLLREHIILLQLIEKHNRKTLTYIPQDLRKIVCYFTQQFLFNHYKNVKT
ncbi:MAG: radical SAM protein [Ignisphaera sp.]